MAKSDSTRSASPSKPTHKKRYLKVCSSYYEHHLSKRPRPPVVPSVQLKGYWLKQVGFEVGKRLQVLTGPDHIVITLAPDEKRAELRARIERLDTAVEHAQSEVREGAEALDAEG